MNAVNLFSKVNERFLSNQKTWTKDQDRNPFQTCVQGPLLTIYHISTMNSTWIFTTFLVASAHKHAI